MSIQFSCPECRTVAGVPDAWAGAVVKCNKCGTDILVPVIFAEAGDNAQTLRNVPDTQYVIRQAQAESPSDRALKPRVGAMVAFFLAMILGVASIGGLAFFLLWPRDTWEQENAASLASIRGDAEAAYASGDYARSLAKSEEIIYLIGSRQVRDPTVRSTLDFALGKKQECRTQLAQIQAKKQRENDRAPRVAQEAPEPKASDVASSAKPPETVRAFPAEHSAQAKAKAVSLPAVSSSPPMIPAPDFSPAPAEPGNLPAVLLAKPSNLKVGGGHIAFADAAFPIVVTTTNLDVQQQLAKTRPPNCSKCRGTDTINKQRVIFEKRYEDAMGAMFRPVINHWQETCPECSYLSSSNLHTSCERCCGKGAACRALQQFLHCCGQCCPANRKRPCQAGCCSKAHPEPTCTQCRICQSLQSFRAAHAEYGVCDYCRFSVTACKNLVRGHGTIIKETYPVEMLILVHSLVHAKRTATFNNIRKAVADRLKLFHEPRVNRFYPTVWNKLRSEAPTGQAILAMGTVRLVAGPDPQFECWQLNDDAGQPQAILLAPAGEVPMVGKVVAGGLLIGTWTPAASRSPCPVVWVVVAVAP
jgi:hypothetical protein